MANRVNKDKIQEVFGHERDRKIHYGKTVSAEEKFYIYHSEECYEATEGRFDCFYTRALDRGIAHPTIWRFWESFQDESVELDIYKGFAIPKVEERN